MRDPSIRLDTFIILKQKNNTYRGYCKNGTIFIFTVEYIVKKLLDILRIQCDNLFRYNTNQIGPVISD